MKNHLLNLAAVLSLGLTSVASAQFTANFEVDQSSLFTVTIATTATPDANANFLYDSATHVQGSGPAITIGPAPSGSSTTRVVRLNANVADAVGTADTAILYPIITTPFANFELTADVWQNYNGAAGGGSGSSNLFLIGAADTTAVAVTGQTAPSIAGTGFYFGLSGEGGFGQDYRYYVGTTTITRNDNIASPAVSSASFYGAAPSNSLNLAPLDNGSPGSLAFFTTPQYETAGAMGKAWTTFRLTKFGTDATLSARRVGDTTFTTIATATGVPAALRPFFAFGDFNTGQATPVSDQFVLIDNISYSILASAEASWSLYQ